MAPWDVASDAHFGNVHVLAWDVLLPDPLFHLLKFELWYVKLAYITRLPYFARLGVAVHDLGCKGRTDAPVAGPRNV